MMANVLHPTIGFHPRPVSHAPSPFGFGFGLGTAGSSLVASPTWVPPQPQPGHTNPAAFQQLASSITQSASSSKSQKRKLDPEDDSDSNRHRDESMDRSPTPERPKRVAPKRPRILNTQNATAKVDSKGRKISEEEEDQVDIGVLLASLPPQSLLPILTGLLKMQPKLKNAILPLIPRPSLEDSVEALKQAAKQLQDAMPFSNTPSYSLHYTFGIAQQPAMRDDYVLGRLRPHIAAFVSTCLSYFPYFSFKYPTATSATKQNNTVQPHPTLQKDKFHPAETFAFLSNVTRLIIDQPAVVIPVLEPLILPRLSEEWKLWVENLDRHANREGSMVAPSVAGTWEVEVGRLGDGKAPGISRLMRGVAQHFPLKQVWGIPSRTMMIEP